MKILNAIAALGFVFVLSVFLPLFYDSVFFQKPDAISLDYSPVLEDFTKRVQTFGKYASVDYYKTDGSKISQEELFELFPFIYYRYLISQNRFPSKFAHFGKDQNAIKDQIQFFRLGADEATKIDVPLYILLESAPKFSKLSPPQDLYSIGDKITFITMRTNTVNKEKSLKFTEALRQAGAVFPIKKTFSNPNIRKPFDEGAFMVDSQSRIFHVKLKNGAPVVINTGIAKDPKYIKIDEDERRDFYGTLSTGDEIYLISYENYELKRLPLKTYAYDKSTVNIRTSPVYRTFSIKDAQQSSCAITQLNYTPHKEKTLSQPLQESAAQRLRRYIFAFSFSIHKPRGEYEILPKISPRALALNLVLTLIYIAAFARQNRGAGAADLSARAGVILASGIYGIIALYFFKDKT
ncbi:MAG: DUF4857 domain-containing protein [Helicobacteraceae bacterium]